MSKVIIPVNKIIRFWEAKLQYDTFLMEPATEVMVVVTIKELKKLLPKENKK